MSRRSRTIDVSPFESVIADAKSAYLRDANYAISMARQASTIQSKRQVWQIRLELRAAEIDAKAQCSASASFTCVNLAPCGTGACLFATGDLREVAVVSTEGPSTRPQESAAPAYSIESAVRPVQAMRAARTAR